MAIDSLFRPLVNKCELPKRAARFFAASGISPNFLTLLSFFFAALAGLSFFFSGKYVILLLLAGISICLNAILDSLDGILAREIGNANKRGDFLDHVFDRYSDVVIMCGIIFGGYISCEIGIIAIIGVLLASYMGTQAQAVGLRRMYGGLLGRADRLLILIVATFATLCYPYPLPASGPLSYSLLGWVMLLFAVLCNITALQRFYYMWRSI